MRKTITCLIIFLFTGAAHSQSVGIGTTTPASSAQLDVSSTTKGFLPPRMTYDQRLLIVNPVAGLVVYCTDCCMGQLQIYNGIVWTNIMGTSPCVPGSVSICAQLWADKNLDVDRYRNGDPIPMVTDPTAWAALTTGAYCYYNNDSTTYAATYGKLYNWYAVNDPRGLAPAGWHVPNNNEWDVLGTASCLGGVLIAGGAMKEAGTLHWLTPNTGATNSSYFTGLPGGSRQPFGSFQNVSQNGSWWSSIEWSGNSSYAHYRGLYFQSAGLTSNNVEKQWGFSVRCLRD